MIQNQDIRNVLLKLKQTMNELDALWEKYDSPSLSEDLCFKYPFGKSFDDLIFELDDWVDYHCGINDYEQ